MTARISRVFSFQSGVYFPDIFRINTYDMDMSFNVETESIQDQNVAIDRVKYFIQECLTDSILVCQNEKAAIEKYTNADIRVCTLPEDPYDQIIAIMLMVKVNAIMEDKLVLTDITITSRLSDEVYCAHSLDDHMGPFVDSGWWSDSSAKMSSIANASGGKKVVKLVKSSHSWDEVGLIWEDSIPIQINSSPEIVFVHFDNKSENNS